jgi:hypothetical protein
VRFALFSAVAYNVAIFAVFVFEVVVFIVDKEEEEDAIDEEIERIEYLRALVFLSSIGEDRPFRHLMNFSHNTDLSISKQHSVNNIT